MPEVSAEHPLVTCILLSYNQERFIRQAVEGALNQTYSPLEIIISDDFSTDNTFEIIKSVVKEYQGPHQVQLNQNSRNIGVTEHMNVLLRRAKGEMIVGMAGDDISYPHRIERVVSEWLKHGKPAGLWSGYREIDEAGNEIKNNVFDLSSDLWASYAILTEKIIEARHRYAQTGTPIIAGVSAAWSKKVYETFGDFLPGTFCEDALFCWRAYLSGGLIFLPEKLVDYRFHTTNLCALMPKHVTSYKECQKNWERAQKRNAGLLQNIVNEQRDLQTAVRLNLVQAEEAAELEGGLQKRYRLVEIQHTWNAMSLVDKIKAIGLKKRTCSWTVALIWFLFNFSFFRYLHFVRTRLKLKVCKV